MEKLTPTTIPEPGMQVCLNGEQASYLAGKCPERVTRTLTIVACASPERVGVSTNYKHGLHWEHRPAQGFILKLAKLDGLHFIISQEEWNHLVRLQAVPSSRKSSGGRTSGESKHAKRKSLNLVELGLI